jgi:hypothetical protein
VEEAVVVAVLYIVWQPEKRQEQFRNNNRNSNNGQGCDHRFFSIMSPY